MKGLDSKRLLTVRTPVACGGLGMDVYQPGEVILQSWIKKDPEDVVRYREGSVVLLCCNWWHQVCNRKCS